MTLDLPYLCGQYPTQNGGGSVKRLLFASQTAYKNGGLMCTSACTCMCIMFLSGGIDVDGDDQESGKAIGPVMDMSNAIHGIVESRQLQPPPPKEQRLQVLPVNRHRTAGVWEVFKYLNLAPEKIGIGLEELVVCKQGLSTSLKKATPLEIKKKPFFYTPSSCFITLDILPDCMRHCSEEGDTVGCVLTCNGHSICMMRGDTGMFAVFDPMPSSLVLGLTSDQVVREISTMIGDISRDQHHQCDATIFYKLS